MWFYLILASIIVLSLAGITALVVSKFPQVTLIDAEALPQEREAKRKKEIIRQRVGRRASSGVKKLRKVLTPVGAWMAKKFRQAHEAVAQLDKKFWEKAAKRIINPAERQRSAVEEVQESKRLLEEGKADEAEKLLIEALSLDRKCLEAYRGLGELYMNNKNYARAKETFAYLAQLSARRSVTSVQRRPGVPGPKTEQAPPSIRAEIAKDHVRLATACRSDGDVRGFRKAMEMAVTHEPANPKNLDLLLEACIEGKDHHMASKVIRVLTEVNPDNQKLPQMKERVAAMQEKEAEAERQPEPVA